MVQYLRRMLRLTTPKITIALSAFDGGVTGLSGWHNGIRDMEVFQPSFHDQRKGTRACSPLTGSSFGYTSLKETMKFLYSISVRTVRFIFGVTGILPVETEFVRYLKAEPFEILLLGVHYILAVPILSEEYDTRFAFCDLFDWLSSLLLREAQQRWYPEGFFRVLLSRASSVPQRFPFLVLMLPSHVWITRVGTSMRTIFLFG
jgi:hypothetical protein